MLTDSHAFSRKLEKIVHKSIKEIAKSLGNFLLQLNTWMFYKHIRDHQITSMIFCLQRMMDILEFSYETKKIIVQLFIVAL